MKKQEYPAMDHSKAKSRRIRSALCNLFGTLILLSVIAFCLPMVVPQFYGYEVYNVVSGSMEPEIPIGSMIMTAPVEPETVEVGDVIAYVSDGVVITHRVTENHVVEGEFVTKGDANEIEDLTAIPYGALVGRLMFHVPIVGTFMDLMTTNVGKIYLLLYSACGLMLNILAGLLRRAPKRK